MVTSLWRQASGARSVPLCSPVRMLENTVKELVHTLCRTPWSALGRRRAKLPASRSSSKDRNPCNSGCFMLWQWKKPNRSSAPLEKIFATWTKKLSGSSDKWKERKAEDALRSDARQSYQSTPPKHAQHHEIGHDRSTCMSTSAAC
jgi:hypothetical protein